MGQCSIKLKYKIDAYVSYKIDVYLKKKKYNCEQNLKSDAINIKIVDIRMCRQNLCFVW